MIFADARVGMTMAAAAASPMHGLAQAGTPLRGRPLGRYAMRACPAQ
jgi:hypothetical protein